ncbi:nucleotide exchange factor GrpE [Candidatus Dependentiae bacterium]|nr:MAG: nucleotide exchange factor GrpE [Candidatus Dependentiae bacterium]
MKGDQAERGDLAEPEGFVILREHIDKRNHIEIGCMAIMGTSKNMNDTKTKVCPSTASSEALREGGSSEERSREARLKGISPDKGSADNEAVSKELDACNATVKEWQEKYMRLSADLENFKRRITKEQQMWREMAQADLLLKLLSIVDNFNRAMEHKPYFASANAACFEGQGVIMEELKSWVEGIAMIYGSFEEFLTSVGIKEVPCEVFDPSHHDALMQVDSDEHESGAIVAVMEKGYMLNNRVLRPAKVSVAK